MARHTQLPGTYPGTVVRFPISNDIRADDKFVHTKPDREVRNETRNEARCLPSDTHWYDDYPEPTTPVWAIVFVCAWPFVIAFAVGYALHWWI
jgi:hypothetical protein